MQGTKKGLKSLKGGNPAHMMVKVTFSKNGILKSLNQYYKNTKKPIPGSLHDIPVKNFK